VRVVGRPLFGAVVLTTICGYTTFAIVRALVFAVEGGHGRHGVVFWLALALLVGLARLMGVFALRQWRRVLAARRPTEA
jgi:hypothetical protein